MSEPDASDPDQFGKLLHAYQEALEGGRPEEAEAIVLGFLALAAQQPVAPTPQSELFDEANHREGEGDYAGAEAAYRRLIALAEAEHDEVALFQAHQQLAALQGLLGRHGEALATARAGVAVSRRIDLSPLLFTALEMQARCALRVGEVGAALAAIEEVLAKIGDGVMHDMQRGRALTVRAECRLAVGDLDAARNDLNAAWAALGPQSGMRIAGGVHAGLARWWAAKARLLAGRGDGEGAAEAWRDAVTRSRYVDALPQAAGPHTRNAVARMLHHLGRCLAANGDPAAADRAFAESRSFREMVHLPPFDPSEDTA